MNIYIYENCPNNKNEKYFICPPRWNLFSGKKKGHSFKVKLEILVIPINIVKIMNQNEHVFLAIHKE